MTIQVNIFDMNSNITKTIKQK